MHAEGFAAGELKHGPIALIEDGVPVIVVVPSPRGRAVLHDKIVSNIQEVRARGALVIAIAEEGDEVDRGVRRPHHPHPRGPDARCSRSSRPSRCRCSPARWPLPRGTTSTSRATSPSPSRWSSACTRTCRHPWSGVGVDIVDTRRFARALARTPRLVDARVHRARGRACPAGSGSGRPSLAARWAAKEAVAKVLIDNRGLEWHHCEVLNGRARRAGARADRHRAAGGRGARHRRMAPVAQP